MILLFDNDDDRYIVIITKMCFWNMVSFLNGGIANKSLMKKIKSSRIS